MTKRTTDVVVAVAATVKKVQRWNCQHSLYWHSSAQVPGGFQAGKSWLVVLGLTSDQRWHPPIHTSLKGTGSPDIECILEVYKINSVLFKRALRSHDYYFRLFIEILLFKVYSYYCENWYWFWCFTISRFRIPAAVYEFSSGPIVYILFM